MIQNCASVLSLFWSFSPPKRLLEDLSRAREVLSRSRSDKGGAFFFALVSNRLSKSSFLALHAVVINTWLTGLDSLFASHKLTSLLFSLVDFLIRNLPLASSHLAEGLQNRPSGDTTTALSIILNNVFVSLAYIN